MHGQTNSTVLGAGFTGIDAKILPIYIGAIQNNADFDYSNSKLAGFYCL
jgi:hypothetical protein